MNIVFNHASAGSGKTYSIEMEVSDRLAKGQLAPQDLMVVTFTVKAADELVSRISGRLLKQGMTESAIGLSNARIGTVHSVCGKLLSEFAFELGLSPTQRVIDDADKNALLAEALDESLNAQDTIELNQLAERLSIDSWASEILSVVEAARLNGIVNGQLAKAATQSVNDFLANCPCGDSAITLTGLKAELQTALDNGRAYVKPTKGLLTSLDSIVRILNQRTVTWENWIQIQKLKAGKKEEHLLASVKAYASRVLASPDFQADATTFITKLFGAAQAVMQRFAEFKARRGLVDFIDQEVLALVALDRPAIRRRIRDQLKFLVVDEFQDTSPIQLALFAKLAALADEVLFVGDAKQAIYGFRGADPRLALDVIQHVKNGGGKLRNLGHSWRSRPGLVHLCNDIFVPAFSHLMDRSQVELSPQTNYTLPTSELTWWKLNGSNQEKRASALAAGIQAIHENRTQVWDKRAKVASNAQWRDIAVLCRGNDEAAKVAGLLVQRGVPVALSRIGLLETPEVMLALACLRRLADPSDSLAAAEIISIATGSNAESWLAERISAVENGTGHDWTNKADPILTRLSESRRDIGILSPAEALSLAIQVADVHRVVLDWHESKRLTEHRLANLQQLKALADKYGDHCSSHHLAGTITGFLLWLRTLEGELQDQQADNPGNAVYIGTYHSAKGLEWPIVICSSLNSALKVSLFGVTIRTANTPFDWNNPLAGRGVRYWPNPFPKQKGNDPLSAAIQQTQDWSDAEQQARNEGIQLLYVGMTRARDQLVLTEEGKDPIGAWLSLLASDLFPVSGGPLILNNGETVSTTLEEIDEYMVVSGSSTTRTRHWLPATSGKASPALQFLRPPSSENPISTAAAAVRHDFGIRLDIGGTTDIEQLGTALHHCLAVSLSTPSGGADGIRTILAQYPSVLTNPADVADLGERLANWIADEYPGAQVHTELPVSRVLPNGQLQSGKIDLALEMPDRWVIVDHKSNPQPKSEWEALAKAHSGQLAAYKEGMEAISGKPVAETLIHFTTSGGLVNVRI